MTNFYDYASKTLGLEVPSPMIPGSWFSENGIPMIVACTCCGSTMSAPSALIDDDGSCYCSSCAGEDY